MAAGREDPQLQDLVLRSRKSGGQSEFEENKLQMIKMEGEGVAGAAPPPVVIGGGDGGDGGDTMAKMGIMEKSGKGGWNTKNLSQRLVVDAGCAVAAGSLVAPIVSMVDK